MVVACLQAVKLFLERVNILYDLIIDSHGIYVTCCHLFIGL